MSIDSHILTALRSIKEGGVSGAELSEKLGISRAAIWARIEAMRELGYDIQASPHFGYRLLSVPDVLHADDLRSRLREVKVIGRDIRVFQETTSTNDVVEKLARDGVKEGAVVFAESQTKGRGRLGRKWISPSGKGLWFSVLLRPDIHPLCITQLTVASATALIRAIRRQTGISAEIKWPNDILIKGRKVAGVLTELSAEMDHVKYVILGIGLDVNLEDSDLPPEVKPLATSLRVETGRLINRAELAAAVMEELDFDYARICEGKFDLVSEEWQRQCSTIGSNVRIRIGDRSIPGVAEALDSDGALLLRTEHGRLERIIGGEVTVEK